MRILNEVPPAEAILPLEQTCPECKSVLLVETLDDLTIAVQTYSENSYGDSRRDRAGVPCPVCRERGESVVFYVVTNREDELLVSLRRKAKS